MVPFMQLFALYVVAHGHHSPGGGFQGGVILGASLILLALTSNVQTVLKTYTEKTVIVSALGVLIFAGWGLIPMLLGSNFLDYSALHVLLPATDEVMARSHSVIVEIGVAMTVMMGMFAIYMSLASDGRMENGVYEPVFVDYYNYIIVVIVMMLGLWGMIAKKNLIQKCIAMAIFQTGIILFIFLWVQKQGLVYRSSIIPMVLHIMLLRLLSMQIHSLKFDANSDCCWCCYAWCCVVLSSTYSF